MNPALGVGKGNIVLLVHPKWHNQVIDVGHCAKNKAIWIKMTGILGGDIGIMGVYVSNLPRERMKR